jgi:ethanolamine transporter EutH
METSPMKRIVLKYGLASSAIVVSLMSVSVGMHMAGRLEDGASELLGYSTMVLAFLLVFFGIRAYREEAGGGAIGFGRAFKVGILITLVTSAVYVLTWEIVYYGFFPNFMADYQARALAQMRAAGEAEAAIAAAQQEMAQFAELYKNPLVNIGVTFLEIFPVGLVMTLVSAGILRRKPTPVIADASAA